MLKFRIGFLLATTSLVLVCALKIKKSTKAIYRIYQLRNRNVIQLLKSQELQANKLSKIKFHYFQGMPQECDQSLTDIEDKKYLLIENRSNSFNQSEKKTLKYVSSYDVVNDIEHTKCTVDNNFPFFYSSNLLKPLIINKDKDPQSFFEFIWNLIKNFNRFEMRINFGIDFKSPILIVGSFIYNPLTKVLRCYHPEYIGNENGFNQLIYQQTLRRLFYICQYLLIGGYLIKTIYYEIQELKEFLGNGKYKNLKALKIFSSQNYKCLLCKKQNHNIIFTPCYHFIVCNDCAQNMDHCQVCTKKIEQKIKIYF